jgi:adenine-specific DNA methylase
MVGFDVSPEDLHLLWAVHLLPVFDSTTNQTVLRQDVVELVPLIKRISEWGGNVDRAGRTLFEAGRPSRLVLPDQSIVDLPTSDREVDPAFYAAIRNLVGRCMGERLSKRSNIGYFPPTRIIAASSAVAELATKQLDRASLVRSSRSGEFANSAHYMGAKRELSTFLLEGFSSAIGPNGVLVDLMCGSGVIAGSAARFWETYASDSQEFCKKLALVQGGGFSRTRAESVLGTVLSKARDHSEVLCLPLDADLSLEDELFHSDLTERLRDRYASFIEEFPLYPASGSHRWSPSHEVGRRRCTNRLTPYLLFTSYFANIYFGLRQCVEIDSLRYGIDNLADPVAREWALGALVASASRVATTYAGHFAQPLVRRWEEVGLNELSRIIEKRALSVFHEFSVRMMNLAQESESVLHRVQVVPGPWQTAVEHLSASPLPSEVLVYVDPPYRREEYSRYYHVLETLVTYDYPTVAGRGRAPVKSAGGRFASEFFTRSLNRMTGALANLIETVLQAGWLCAWSYADNSDASVSGVLSDLGSRLPISCRSYATPYEHQSQGGRKPKRVTEYLVIVARR